jgi:hypothetical protein
MRHLWSAAREAPQTRALRTAGLGQAADPGATCRKEARRCRLKADRTKDRALLGSNPSVAPVAEIGSGRGLLFPDRLTPHGALGLPSEAWPYLGT